MDVSLRPMINNSNNDRGGQFSNFKGCFKLSFILIEMGNLDVNLEKNFIIFYNDKR